MKQGPDAAPSGSPFRRLKPVEFVYSPSAKRMEDHVSPCVRISTEELAELMENQDADGTEA